MSWITLNSDDVKRRLSGPELAALQGTALAAGQSDPLPGVLSEVTDEIRGYVATWPENVLGEAGTIPPQLKSAAISIARWRLGGRLPAAASPLFQSENRKKENDDAVKLLERCAEGKFAVERPAVEASEQINGAAPSYGGEDKHDFMA
jgi:hypothetical protein